MSPEIEMSLYVLILAVPLGLQLVQRVSPLLHTPLMSLTNAISAISSSARSWSPEPAAHRNSARSWAA
jgi:NAD/NADP transhydrogenase alpha subunit